MPDRMPDHSQVQRRGSYGGDCALELARGRLARCTPLARRTGQPPPPGGSHSTLPPAPPASAGVTISTVSRIVAHAVAFVSYYIVLHRGAPVGGAGADCGRRLQNDRHTLPHLKPTPFSPTWDSQHAPYSNRKTIPRAVRWERWGVTARTHMGGQVCAKWSHRAHDDHTCGPGTKPTHMAPTACQRVRV